jgi:Uma2 family endonuclease
MATYPVRTRRWTRAQYERLADLGVFGEDEPLELIGGQLIVAEPKGNPHAVAVGLASEALREAFGSGWAVRVQDPVALDDESEPEPDVAVVAGSHRDYLSGHPARPVLVVEVAESSLQLDREHKGSLYARAGLADYWIVNLVDQQVEIYRVPGPDAAAAYGWRYQSVTILDASASISPLAAPTTRITTSDLLP